VPSPCDIPGVGQLCNTVGDGITAAAGSIFDAAAQKLAEGLADATKVGMTFWTDLPMPQLSTSTGPVAALQSMTYWVSGFVAVLSMVIAAGQMAWSRSGQPAGRAAKGILTLIIASGAGVAAVNALGYFGDQYSQWILDRSANGDLGARLDSLSKISIIPGLGSGLVLIVALVAILASLAQMGLMLVRIGVVTMLAGTLPLAAAGTATATGQAWFQRVVAWLLAFVLYKPAAATVYASAFLLVGQGQDAAAVLSGLFMMILAIVALPALLRLITPAVAAATSSGAAGGAAAAAGVGAVATGARMAADRGGRGSPQPQGSAHPGLVGTSPAGGPGGSRSGSAAGTARGAGSAGAASATAGGAGAAAAAGTAGASLVVAGAAKAAQAATTGAKSAASTATGDDGQ
jgi:type IV secretion system protein TrbL